MHLLNALAHTLHNIDLQNLVLLTWYYLTRHLITEAMNVLYNSEQHTGYD